MTLILLVQDSALLADEGCTAGGCHLEMQTGANTHPPEQPCQRCHANQDRTPHPTRDGERFNPESNELCTECHKVIFDYTNLHPPVAAGRCFACHNPHANRKGFYLKQRGQALCTQCHDPVSTPEDTVLHGEVHQGKCRSCHAPHGAFFDKLLRGKYSTSFFVDYTGDEFTLCFDCHKIDLLLHPRTSYNTEFRDGKRNLHYLHTNRPNRGRACKLCHEVHAGSQPKLMATEIPFGDWQMPINFRINETGGSCAPGCHEPASYNRNKGRSRKRTPSLKESP